MMLSVVENCPFIRNLHSLGDFALKSMTSCFIFIFTIKTVAKT
jgi:hypothetical protein